MLFLRRHRLRRLGVQGCGEAGRAALTRVIATLPERQAQQAMHAVMRSISAQKGPAVPDHVDMDLIRRACWDESSLKITYRDLKEAVTRREIWPLGISYSEQTLMLLAMCRMRGDYRVFHIPRMMRVEAGTESFRPRRVALVRAYVEERRRRAGSCGDA